MARALPPAHIRQYGENSGPSSNLTLVVSNFILGMANAPQQRVYEFGDFRIDADHRMLYHQGSEIPVVPKVVETLLALIERRGKVVSKDELLEAVWPDTVVEESNLFVYLSVLRKTLGTLEDGRPYVETLRRRGYRFNGDVHLVEEAVEDKNYELPVDEFEQSRANIQSQPARVHVVKNWNRNTTESEKIISASSLVPALIPFESSQDLTPSKKELISDEVSTDLEVAEYIATGIKRHKLAFAICLLVLAAGIVGTTTYVRSWRKNVAAGRAIQSLAVVPFRNESGNADVEYLSDGMSESLINSLSQLPNLSVKAPGVVFRYKDKETDPQTIAAELSVQAILSGRVVQRDDDLTLYLSLVDGRNGNQLWGEQYDRKMTDLVALQNEIARDVSRELRARLSGADTQGVARNYTQSVEAYQLYLKGRHHAGRNTPSETQRAISYYQQAIEIDPNYALAYVKLSNAYLNLALTSEIPATEVMPKAKAAANKAIEIDDTLAEAHQGLCSISGWYDWNLNAAEKHIKRALELNPNSADVQIEYAGFLSNTGRQTEALVEVKHGIELDPSNFRYRALEGLILIRARQYDEGLAVLQKVIEQSPNYWQAHVFAIPGYTEQGKFTEALASARQACKIAGNNPAAMSFLGQTLAKAGKRAEARVVLEEMLRLSKERHVSPYNIAMVYNGLEDRAETFVWLERAYELREPRMSMLPMERKWDNLRSDPRFQDLLRRMGLK